MFKEMILASQLMCMTEAVYYESRGEAIEGMELVAAVVHNRALDYRWEDTYCDVIEEPYQFSYLGSRSSGTLPMPNKVAKTVAHDIAEDTVQHDEPIKDNVLYFHRYDQKPKDWNFSLLRSLGRTGDHIYYTDR